MRFQKILVIGTCGSGKTTLAKRISEGYQLPRIELDTLRWEPGWVEVPDEVFTKKVLEIEERLWVIDGNYSKVRHILWPQADLVIWLDFPLWRNLWRLLKRSFDNLWHQKPLCNGNYESIRRQFFSKDSIFAWCLKTHRKKRREYLEVMQSNPYPNITFVHIRSPKELEAFLQPSADEKRGFPSNV